VKASEFEFDLPESSIARYPADRRDESRLMVLDRQRGTIEHHTFAELPDLVGAGWTMVMNDARVLPARLFGKKVPSGGKVEILLVEEACGARRWRAMAASSKPMRAGQRIDLGAGLEGSIAAVEGDGFVLIDLPEDGREIAKKIGRIPLPPYLGREAEPLDADRYQTVYSDRHQESSVAAPTAGLHFTPEVLSRLEAGGVRRVAITLDVGPGTFLPVRSESLEDHQMHSERFVVTPDAAEAIESARRERRVLAIGTTVVRTLESMPERIVPGEGRTKLFIRPGFRFEVVDRLLTNFHLPRSTLLMLVSAFAGRERILDAYRIAVREGYRFFSYGDAMLIR
jgi:S-adenosylmethionine:tRNA ribosyltransferase-isomerase